VREYVTDDFTKISDEDDLDVVYSCNGCGALFYYLDEDSIGSHHFDGCSTERIDLEKQRVKEGYYDQDEEEEK
jgi:hypothetical protein